VCDFMFDLFCFLKTLGGPCKKWFGEYTEEIRYQGLNAHLSVLPAASPQNGHEFREIATSKPL